MSDVIKTAIEQIFDNINLTSTVVLDYKDFDVSVPAVYFRIGVKANTKITIKPKTNAVYYNSKDIFYYRMDLGEILASGAIEIIPTTETLLSELIPQINAAYGIVLTEDDYYEQTLPLYDPTSATPVRVTVMAKDTSYLFYGNYSLQIGTRQTPVIDDDGVTRIMYIQKGGVSLANYKKKLTSINNDGTENTNFSLLRNATAVTQFDLTNFVVNSDQQLLLSGVFKFTMQNNGELEPTEVDATFLTLNVVGAVIEHNSTGLRAASNSIAILPTLDDFYVLDKTNSVKPRSLFKFAKDGSEVTAYSATGISYTPDFISLTPEGNLYTISPGYSDSGMKVRIDRLLPSGALDTTFNPIIISNTSVNTLMPVVSVCPVANNGLWVLLNPSRGVSSTADTPIVNGAPIVPGNGASAFAWNPLLRFRQNGLLETNFNILLRDFEAKSIMEINSNLVVGANAVVAETGYAMFLTYRPNPATGFSHRQPIVFSDTGALELLSGVDYANMFRWVTSTNLIHQSNDQALGYGTMLPKLGGGGWGDPISAICRYSKKGVPVEVLYRENNTDLVDTNVVITKVVMVETS